MIGFSSLLYGELNDLIHLWSCLYAADLFSWVEVGNCLDDIWQTPADTVTLGLLLISSCNRIVSGCGW